jgi:hypothetical protein
MIYREVQFRRWGKPTGLPCMNILFKIKMLINNYMR